MPYIFKTRLFSHLKTNRFDAHDSPGLHLQGSAINSNLFSSAQSERSAPRVLIHSHGAATRLNAIWRRPCNAHREWNGIEHHQRSIGVRRHRAFHHISACTILRAHPHRSFVCVCVGRIRNGTWDNARSPRWPHTRTCWWQQMLRSGVRVVWRWVRGAAAMRAWLRALARVVITIRCTVLGDWEHYRENDSEMQTLPTCAGELITHDYISSTCSMPMEDWQTLFMKSSYYVCFSEAYPEVVKWNICNPVRTYKVTVFINNW